MKVVFTSKMGHLTAKFLPQNEDERHDMKRAMKGAGMQPDEWVNTDEYMSLQIDVEFHLGIYEE
jgi:hypothetical protein